MAYGASSTPQSGLLGRILESPSHDRTLLPLRPPLPHIKIRPIRGFVRPHLAPRETPPNRDSLPLQTLTQQEASYALFPAPCIVLSFRSRPCSHKFRQRAPQ